MKETIENDERNGENEELKRTDITAGQLSVTDVSKENRATSFP